MAMDRQDPTARFRLDGEVAIVTGIGPGIGEHVARAYAAAGAKVVLCARTQSKVEALAEAIGRDGGEALPLAADVGDRVAIGEVVRRARERFGTVTILFNNAAATPPGPGEALAIPDEHWEASFAVNLMAPFRLAQAVIPGMKVAGHGSIINVLSTAGFTPIAGIRAIAYGTTKAGLEMMTRYIAKECAPEVRANCLCPGTISPDGAMREVWKNVVPGVPLGRVGRADETVGAALFLAAAASSYVTGQTIFVDGGRVNTIA